MGIKVLCNGGLPKRMLRRAFRGVQIASMYAIMLETDYMTKQKFLDNFWVDFRGVLGRSHVIKGLAKCNFRPIYDHLMAEREKKKALSREVWRCLRTSFPDGVL